MLSQKHARQALVIPKVPVVPRACVTTNILNSALMSGRCFDASVRSATSLCRGDRPTTGNVPPLDLFSRSLIVLVVWARGLQIERLANLENRTVKCQEAAFLDGVQQTLLNELSRKHAPRVAARHLVERSR